MPSITTNYHCSWKTSRERTSSIKDLKSVTHGIRSKHFYDLMEYHMPDDKAVSIRVPVQEKKDDDKKDESTIPDSKSVLQI